MELGGCQSLNKGSFGAFKRSFNTKAHGYQIVADLTGTAPTKLVERFEVWPGDCSSFHGWSDCANDREGSELSGDRENDRRRDHWYCWSLYVPVDPYAKHQPAWALAPYPPLVGQTRGGLRPTLPK